MRRVGSLLALSLLAVSCAPAREPPAPAPSPASPEIQASCGGGVTGGSEGVTISPDDHVISWRRSTAAAAPARTDHGADPAFAADVRRQLDTIRFERIAYGGSGNMTCMLAAGEHRVSWSRGDPNAPAGAVAVFELVFSAGGRE